ncbi:hypothetical protein UFOVP655_68 [uncultured Caudovirales phage]|uniref:Uncharacterized protein n=1 Tax=uncultured Caudovirales phage TaxID=2100421 RepID=A0A6J5NMM6_9CAUD|nr:hypothetical protein UFOVP655_68 [uncultured Caudovirales phage]
MAEYTLYPNANWNGDDLFTATGGTAYGVLADNSDSTYLRRTDLTVPASYETEFQTQTIPSDEQIISVNLWARISSLADDSLAQFSLGVITDRNGKTVYYGIPISKQGIVSAFTYDLGITLTSAPNGAVWTQTLLDNLVVKFTDGATGSTVLPPDPTNRTTLYKLYAVVKTAPRPTLTVTAPSGTVTDTSFPSINWTPTFADGEPQSAYEIKIFDATTYGGSSFSADTSTPIITTGIVTSTSKGQTLEGDLANSTTYRAYVRVASLINGANYFSAWAYSEFTLSIDSPATPTVSAYYNSTDGSVAVTIFGRTNVLTANQASLETNTTGWTATANCSISRSTSQYSSGTASLALLSAASGDMTASTNGTRFPVTANNKFSATAEFKSGSTARACSTGIVWYNAAGTVLSTIYGTAENDSSSAWNESGVTATAPATAASAQVIVKVASAGSGETHYVDKIAFHAGTNPVWTRGAFGSFSFAVERSSDNGLTWVAVRNSPITASTAQIATLSDYETPLDTTVIYRAKARAEI